MRRTAVLWVLVTLGVCTAATGLEVPYLTGRVVDQAGLIDGDTLQRIEAKLERLEEETAAQLVVLTIPDLQGEPVEDFSMRVVETWQLGREQHDDGLLLLVAQGDRKMRIEVGYGLEDRVTDLLAGRILDRIVAPRFRAGDFAGGIEAGVDALTLAVSGESVGDSVEMSDDTQMDLAGRLFGLAIFTIVIGIFSLLALVSPGWGGWFLYVFLLPFYFMFPRLLLGPVIGASLFLAWVIGYPLLRLLLPRLPGWDQFAKRRVGQFRRGSDGERWTTGSFGGSGWSGGGGGGFSGGGGSFGGGGASGSW